MATLLMLVIICIVLVVSVQAIANRSGGSVRRYDPIRYQSPVITDAGNVCNGCSTAGINSGQRGGRPELTEWDAAGRTSDDGCTTHEERGGRLAETHGHDRPEPVEWPIRHEDIEIGEVWRKDTASHEWYKD